jgi:hypothetical protein
VLRRWCCRIVLLSDDGRLLGQPTGTAIQFLLWSGTLLLLTSAVLAGLVVIPRLRKKATLRAEHSQNFIYFSHLQFWKPDELATALREQDSLPVLSNQLINTSKIVWTKHRHVQRSFLRAGAGALLVSTAGILT